MLIIDISKNNGIGAGAPNWDKIKTNNTPITGVMIKSSEGIGYADPMVKYHVEGAKRVGLPVGFYHFCSLNDEDVVKDSTGEANWFLKTISPYPCDLFMVLDIERNDKKYYDAHNILVKKDVATNLDGTLKPGYKAVRTLYPDKFLKWINTFFSIIDGANKPSMIYSGKYFMDENLPANHGLGNKPLWLAQYPTNYTAASKPSIPKGWTNYEWWQYSCTGKINGINGNVDLSKSLK